MSWLDDLIGIGSGVTSDLSPEQLASAGSDSWWMPSQDMSGFRLDVPYLDGTTYGYDSPMSSPYVAAPLEPGRSLGYSIAGSVDAAPAESTSSPWDTFSNGLQKIGDFTGSKGGQFLMGGLGSLAAYLDAKKKNALMKQMMEQAAAEKAAKAARAAMYDSATPAVLARTPQAWGAGTQAFANNGLARNATSNTMFKAADGGQPPAPQKTGVLDFLRFLATGEAERQTTQQKEAARLEAERRAKLSPSELQAEKINNAYEDGRLQKATQRARGGFIAGSDPGQSDKVPSLLSDGEFVMDADTVSALGDGNNAAGASALEKMRQNIRAHKRAAPVTKIPPKAKKPEAYLKGAK